MSSSTFSQMIMGESMSDDMLNGGNGGSNGLNGNGPGSLGGGGYSRSFTQHFLDDIGLDEDDFFSSKIDVFIPELYDTKLMDNFDYLSSRAHLFIDCKSRKYLIQGELLKFFLIVRPPESSKKRFKQQQLQFKIQQQYNIQQQLQDTSTPPPVKLNIINEEGTNNNSNSNNNSDDIFNETKVVVLPPSPSSSHNLQFEIHFRSTESDKSKDYLSKPSIIDYYPKHSYISTEMRNDHISSSKATTQYLRVNSNNNNNNNNNNNSGNSSNSSNTNTSNSNQINNNNKFLGDIIEWTTPFSFKDTTLSQKPNFFRLSNGDLVYPVQVPITINRTFEGSSIQMSINVSRPTPQFNSVKFSANNKLTQLILNVNDPTGSIMNLNTPTTPAVGSIPGRENIKSSIGFSNTSSSSSSTSTATIAPNTSTNKPVNLIKSRTMLKLLTLVQPLKTFLQSSTVCNIGNKSLSSILIENCHSSLETTIHSIEIYLAHIQTMEPVENFYQGYPNKHHQPGQSIKVSDYYTIRSLTRHILPIKLEPTNKYSFVLSIEPTSTTSIRPPTDGYHTKVAITWSLPTSPGRILSLYELKTQPPFTTDIMVSANNPSPVKPNSKFQVFLTVSNLSSSDKNLTLSLPQPTLRQTVSLDAPSALSPVTMSTAQCVLPIGQHQSSINLSTTLTNRPGSMPLQPLSSNDLAMSLGSSTGSIASNIEPSISKDYSAPKFQDMAIKTLMSFEEQQRNSIQLICLQKSVHVGTLSPGVSKSIAIEFIPLYIGNFEISNIQLFDSITKKYYSLKEPIQITCI